MGALTVASAALLASGTANAQTDEDKYLTAAASTYKGKVAVTNSDTKIVVSSAGLWQSGDQGDTYLGATIDKASKSVKYFTYQTQQVVGDWAGYTKAKLTTPSGPLDVKVTYKNDKILECTEQCRMQEMAGFVVDRALLDAYASKKPSASEKLSWALISSKGAQDAPGMLSVGEIKAFLDEVDTQKRAK